MVTYPVIMVVQILSPLITKWENSYGLVVNLLDYSIVLSAF